MKRIIYRAILVLAMIVGVHLAGKISKAIACVYCTAKIPRSCAVGTCYITNRPGCPAGQVCFGTDCVTSFRPYTTHEATLCYSSTFTCLNGLEPPPLEGQCTPPGPAGC